jgi:hypothetical protein
MVVSCAFFGPRHSPYSNYLCRAPDIAEVGTIFNVFSYDAVSVRDSNLSPSRRQADALSVEPRSTNDYLCKISDQNSNSKCNLLIDYEVVALTPSPLCFVLLFVKPQKLL